MQTVAVKLTPIYAKPCSMINKCKSVPVNETRVSNCFRTTVNLFFKTGSNPVLIGFCNRFQTIQNLFRTLENICLYGFKKKKNTHTYS